MRTFTLSEIAAAIRLDGKPQTVRMYHNPTEDSYCAIGMAGHNLEVDPDNLAMAMNAAEIKTDNGTSLASYVFALNDSHSKSFDEIADALDELVTAYGDTNIDIIDDGDIEEADKYYGTN